MMPFKCPRAASMPASASNSRCTSSHRGLRPSSVFRKASICEDVDFGSSATCDASRADCGVQGSQIGDELPVCPGLVIAIHLLERCFHFRQIGAFRLRAGKPRGLLQGIAIGGLCLQAVGTGQRLVCFRHGRDERRMPLGVVLNQCP